MLDDKTLALLGDRAAQERLTSVGVLLKVRGRDQETGDKLAQDILALAEAIRGCAE